MKNKVKTKKTLWFRIKKYKLLLPIMIIGVVYYFIFQYIPIIWGVIISFKDMKVGNTIANAPWVGWENYLYVVTNSEMLKLVKNTLVISVSKLVWSFWPPILLTIVVFDLKSNKFRRISQTIIYLPHFFSWVIIYGIAYAFFSETGLINGIIGFFGGGTVSFLTSSKAFVPMIVGTSIWKEMGWNTILYFAALTGVNPDLYEAAKLDGAGPIARTVAVTLPAMVPVISFSLIMALGNILGNDFEQILLFYNSAVYDVGDIIDTWVYRVGLGKMQYSVGSAVSVMKAFVSMILVCTSNYVSKRLTGRGMF